MLSYLSPQGEGRFSAAQVVQARRDGWHKKTPHPGNQSRVRGVALFWINRSLFSRSQTVSRGPEPHLLLPGNSDRTQVGGDPAFGVGDKGYAHLVVRRTVDLGRVFLPAVGAT